MKVICDQHKTCGNTTCRHASEHESSEKCDMTCDTIKGHTVCKSSRKDKLIKLENYINDESYL